MIKQLRKHLQNLFGWHYLCSKFTGRGKMFVRFDEILSKKGARGPARDLPECLKHHINSRYNCFSHFVLHSLLHGFLIAQPHEVCLSMLSCIHGYHREHETKTGEKSLDGLDFGWANIKISFSFIWLVGAELGYRWCEQTYGTENWCNWFIIIINQMGTCFPDASSGRTLM